MTTSTAFPMDDVEFRPPLAPEKPPPEQSFFQSLCRMRVACHVLDLKPEVRFTAMVLLHRYAQASASLTTTTSTEISPMVAAACILLGCKVEDDLRRLRDIVNIESMILGGPGVDLLDNETKRSDAAADEATSPRELWIRSDPPALNDTYWNNKEKLVATEQDVLRVLQFDCSVPHPHRAVAILLIPESTDDASAPPSEAIQNLIQSSWQYLDHALFYSPALQHAVLPLACASILLVVDDVTDDDARPPEWSKFTSDTLWWHDYGAKDLQVEFAKRDLKQASNLYNNAGQNGMQ